LIDPGNVQIPICRQCELLGLSRSSYYYESQRDDRYNLMLMNLIDGQFTRTPFYGVPRMTAWLNGQGHEVNHKRVRRLMRLMGLQAIYPKPRLSNSNQTHKKYPYLLKGLTIDHADQVWCSDISVPQQAA
jgi:putative transposase